MELPEAASLAVPRHALAVEQPTTDGSGAGAASVFWTFCACHLVVTCRIWTEGVDWRGIKGRSPR